MEKRIIKTNLAPQAIGPYSQGVEAGNIIFLAGQVPLDPATGEVIGTTIEEQTVRCLENLKGILSSQSLTLEHWIMW